jgi:hypothetical protein
MYVNLGQKNLSKSNYIHSFQISDFHIYFVLFCDFVVFVRHWLFVVCDVVCFSCFSQVFDRFRLSDQLRSTANPINDFGVIHVVDPESLLFRRFKYSHMCRHLYFAVLCYQHGCCESVHNSSFLFLANLHYIDVLFQFE